jgi:SAM-dependent methyltransferase
VKYVTAAQNVLDIGSPKLLSLSLAVNMQSVIVHSIDILQAEADEAMENASRLRCENLVPGVQDARCLGYADNSFDLIVSLSVFEHIAPEMGGEVPASRELGRILAPKGIAVLTVPFSRTYFAEYRVGQIYERASSHEEPIFFQRFYDYDLLMRNIVQASGLDLLYLGFIEERFFSRDPRKRMAHYVNSSPRQNALFGLFFPILSRVFLSAPKPLESCKKPYVACLVLKKH